MCSRGTHCHSYLSHVATTSGLQHAEPPKQPKTALHPYMSEPKLRKTFLMHIRHGAHLVLDIALCEFKPCRRLQVNPCFGLLELLLSMMWRRLQLRSLVDSWDHAPENTDHFCNTVKSTCVQVTRTSARHARPDKPPWIVVFIYTSSKSKHKFILLVIIVCGNIFCLFEFLVLGGFLTQRSHKKHIMVLADLSFFPVCCNCESNLQSEPLSRLACMRVLFTVIWSTNGALSSSVFALAACSQWAERSNRLSVRICHLLHADWCLFSRVIRVMLSKKQPPKQIPLLPQIPSCVPSTGSFSSCCEEET